MATSAVRLKLCRDRRGVSLGIQINDVMSDFVKSFGNREQLEASNWGTRWRNLNDNPVMVWDASNADLSNMFGPVRYRLDLPGCQLVSQDDYGREILNLSFLRIVGAESPEGAHIVLEGMVSSTDYLEDLRSRILNACRRLYVDFVRPVELEGVVTQVVINDTAQ